MMLNNKLRKIRDAFAKASPNVYHYWREQKQYPCIVWQESGEDDSFFVNDKKVEQSVAGTLDYFTRTEFDPAVDEIQRIFASLCIAWQLSSVQYEEDTNLIHYEWSWGIL